MDTNNSALVLDDPDSYRVWFWRRILVLAAAMRGNLDSSMQSALSTFLSMPNPNELASLAPLLIGPMIPGLIGNAVGIWRTNHQNQALASLTQRVVHLEAEDKKRKEPEAKEPEAATTPRPDEPKPQIEDKKRKEPEPTTAAGTDTAVASSKKARKQPLKLPATPKKPATGPSKGAGSSTGVTEESSSSEEFSSEEWSSSSDESLPGSDEEYVPCV